MLLILTEQSDLAVDYVVCQLRERGLPHFRLNSEDFGGAAYHVESATNGFNSRVSIDGRELDFGQVRSVWYRRQPAPEPSSSVPAEQRSFASGELRNLVEGVLPLSTARWIDHPSAVWRAERKLQQLALAHKIGFSVPATLVSSDESDLRLFLRQHENTGVVCKPIYRSLFISPDGCAHVAYTKLVREGDLDALGSGTVFPTLLQQRVPKSADLRITVVGSHFFSVRITTPQDAIDWRAPEADPHYCHADTPRALETTCRRFLDEFNLTYGAFDFAEGPDGTPFFLEVNPVGEWAWLDRELNLGIREALIDEFFSNGEH